MLNFVSAVASTILKDAAKALAKDALKKAGVGSAKKAFGVAKKAAKVADYMKNPAKLAVDAISEYTPAPVRGVISKAQSIIEANEISKQIKDASKKIDDIQTPENILISARTKQRVVENVNRARYNKIYANAERNAERLKKYGIDMSDVLERERARLLKSKRPTQETLNNAKKRLSVAGMRKKARIGNISVENAQYWSEMPKWLKEKYLDEMAKRFRYQSSNNFVRSSIWTNNITNLLMYEDKGKVTEFGGKIKKRFANKYKTPLARVPRYKEEYTAPGKMASVKEWRDAIEHAIETDENNIYSLFTALRNSYVNRSGSETENREYRNDIEKSNEKSYYERIEDSYKMYVIAAGKNEDEAKTIASNYANKARENGDYNKMMEVWKSPEWQAYRHTFKYDMEEYQELERLVSMDGINIQLFLSALKITAHIPTAISKSQEFIRQNVSLLRGIDPEEYEKRRAQGDEIVDKFVELTTQRELVKRPGKIPNKTRETRVLDRRMAQKVLEEYFNILKGE